MAAPSEIYHERQKKMLCAKHVLNNLLQREEFTKEALDNICYKLSPESMVNPHKNMFGLGNYDINVIAFALQTLNLSLVWFDKRKNVKNLVLENIKGFILNVSTDHSFGIIKLPIHGKHWYVIREINGTYYNLDSKLSAPEPFKCSDTVLQYLGDLLRDKNKELLLVVEDSIDKDGSWICSDGQKTYKEVVNKENI